MSVVPERGMPMTKIGTSQSAPRAAWREKKSGVKRAITRSATSARQGGLNEVRRHRTLLAVQRS